MRLALDLEWMMLLWMAVYSFASGFVGSTAYYGSIIGETGSSSCKDP